MNTQLSALVRAATATTKASRALASAVADEAAEVVLLRRREALSRALEAQDAALVELAKVQHSSRPSEPLDAEKLVDGFLRGFEIAKTAGERMKALGKDGAPPARPRKPVIDVDPSE